MVRVLSFYDLPNWHHMTTTIFGDDILNMAWISLQSLSIAAGGKTLINDITFTIDANDRIGVVGPNGMGKSTLLSIIAGDTSPESGTRKIFQNPKIARIHQWQQASNSSIWQIAHNANSEVHDLASQLRQTENAMAEHQPPERMQELTEHWGNLSERFSDLGGYEWDSRVRSYLLMLGFPESRWHDSIQHLSGGEKHRMALLQVLLSGSDIWLLDEPNNHLDITTLEWLEQQIRSFSGAVVLVSHDRTFLNHTVTRVITWEDGFFWSTSGSWTKYHNLRKERLKTEATRYQRMLEEENRLKQYIARYRTGSRARQAQSRLKRLNKIESVKPAAISPPTSPQLLHNSTGKSGREPLAIVQNLMIHRPHRTWDALTFKIPQGAKIALVGANGTGKSTFLDTLYESPPQIRWHQEIQIAYLKQSAVAELPEGHNAFDYLNEQGYDREEIYFIGHRFGLSPDLLTNTLLDKWSGGERIRLKLLETLLLPSQLLLLDEPTNHLDIAMRLSLESLIKDYPGTVIIASHERAFLSAISTHTLWSTGKEFIWDKEAYRDDRQPPSAS